MQLGADTRAVGGAQRQRVGPGCQTAQAETGIEGWRAGLQHGVVAECGDDSDCASLVGGRGARHEQRAVDESAVHWRGQRQLRRVGHRHLHSGLLSCAGQVGGGDHHHVAARAQRAGVEREAVGVECRAAAEAGRAGVGRCERWQGLAVDRGLDLGDAVLRACPHVDIDAAGRAGDRRIDGQVGIDDVERSPEFEPGIGAGLDARQDQVRAVGGRGRVPAHRVAGAGSAGADQLQVGVPGHRAVGRAGAAVAHRQLRAARQGLGHVDQDLRRAAGHRDDDAGRALRGQQRHRASADQCLHPVGGGHRQRTGPSHRSTRAAAACQGFDRAKGGVRAFLRFHPVAGPCREAVSPLQPQGVGGEVDHGAELGRSGQGSIGLGHRVWRDGDRHAGDRAAVDPPVVDHQAGAVDTGQIGREAGFGGGRAIQGGCAAGGPQGQRPQVAQRIAVGICAGAAVESNQRALHCALRRASDSDGRGVGIGAGAATATSAA